MISVVIKRDGCRVPFDAQRIVQAVNAAAQAAAVNDNDYAQQLAAQVATTIAQQAEVDIHEIQRAVENALMSGP